uniref:Uncharacterized protein n=1 Tax=Oryza meridionalis TaxID=40149 RepID=A0A0E0F0H1_9ORYZ
MAEDANAGRKSSTHSAQSPELHASLESQELYNIPITRGEGTLITELRKVTEELRVSYYADTDEETREQLKQFWDDEFNAISSGETTIERDLKWMRKEVIEAFETYSHCHGCRNSGIDLKHPSNGGYEEGDADSGFSFDPI